MPKHFEEMSQLDRIDKKMKFKIVGRNGETVIKEFGSQYEADLYCERLNYERLERLGVIEHLSIPAIDFEQEYITMKTYTKSITTENTWLDNRIRAIDENKYYITEE